MCSEIGLNCHGCGGELLILLLGTPIEEIGRVKGDAKEVCGYETELGGADADNTDDGAIQGGNNPALPELFANEDGGQDRQNTRDIIESNHLEHVQHVWLMSRCRSLLKQFTGALGVPVLLLNSYVNNFCGRVSTTCPQGLGSCELG